MSNKYSQPDGTRFFFGKGKCLLLITVVLPLNHLFENF